MEECLAHKQGKQEVLENACPWEQLSPMTDAFFWGHQECGLHLFPSSSAGLSSNCVVTTW